jgi:hypothetical protein
MTYDIQAVGESQEAPEPTDVVAALAQKQIEGKSPWILASRRLRRDRAAMICLGVIILIVACAIGAPVFAELTGHGNMQQFTCSVPMISVVTCWCASLTARGSRCSSAWSPPR